MTEPRAHHPPGLRRLLLELSCVAAVATAITACASGSGPASPATDGPAPAATLPAPRDYSDSLTEPLVVR
ncbi:MAG TPA: hypothetical protein VFY65_10810, partial [Longimicrobium sp.]|nr:hypothetical protein [Longimicrobium sp.]